VSSLKTCLSLVLGTAAILLCVACGQPRTARECANLPGQRVKAEPFYFINQVQLDEGDSYFICFRGKNQRVIGPDVGELLFLQTGRIVIVGSSSHYVTRRSIVLDTKGDTLATIEHGEVARFGNSTDGRIFWLVEFRGTGENGPDSVPTAEGILKVFSANGAHVLTRPFSEAGSIEAEVEGNRYTIPFPKPELPG
jgi:hypothetical protein